MRLGPGRREAARAGVLLGFPPHRRIHQRGHLRANAGHAREGLGHFNGGREPAIGVTGERALEEGVDPRAEGGDDFGGAAHGPGDDIGDDSGNAFALEGELASEGAEHDNGEGPEVAAAVDGFRALDLLGAHVMGRADEITCFGAFADVGAARFDDSEVEDFDDFFAVVGSGEEDVARLEVAVDVAGFVEAAEAAGDLVGDSGDLLDGEAAYGFEAFEEVFAFEELHDEVGDAALDAAIFDVDEVLMADPGRGFGLALKTGEGRRRGEVGGVHEFDGNVRSELDVLGNPDGSLAAGCEAATEAVFASYR